MPLSGTLQTLNLPDLIQLQCSQPKSQVRIAHAGRVGILWFADGELVYASVGAVTGDAAMYEMLDWDTGDFTVSEVQEAPPLRNIHAPWSTLVLEGLRRVDEARAAGVIKPQEILQEGMVRRDLQSAVVVNGSGEQVANTTTGKGEAETALVMFVASRALALAESTKLGTFERLVVVYPPRKMSVDKLTNGYLGCWMDEPSPLEPINALVHALKDSAGK